MGHTKPNAAHCFCAVAFQGGVAALAFIRRRSSTGLPASDVSESTLSSFPILLHCLPCRELRPAASSRWLFATVPPSSSPWHSRPAVPLQRPCQQHLPDGAPPRRLGQQETSSAPPASNKPHPAGKSTPVWLAIWRTWAGFANSQLRCAAFCCTYSYICTIPVTAALSSCSDIANLSAYLHRLPTPPTYLRRMRLLHGRGAGIR